MAALAVSICGKFSFVLLFLERERIRRKGQKELKKEEREAEKGQIQREKVVHTSQAASYAVWERDLSPNIVFYFLLLISRERKEERKRIKGFMDKRKSEKDKTRERKRGDHSQTASHAVWTRESSLITLLNIPHSQNKPFSH